MILTETKITDQVDCHNSMGYKVLCLKTILAADGYEQYVVGMIFREGPQGCIFDLTRFCRTNVVIYEVITVKRTPLIGAYPPLHPGAPTGLGGSTDTLLVPGYHSVKSPQR